MLDAEIRNVLIRKGGEHRFGPECGGRGERYICLSGGPCKLLTNFVGPRQCAELGSWYMGGAEVVRNARASRLPRARINNNTIIATAAILCTSTPFREARSLACLH